MSEHNPDLSLKNVKILNEFESEFLVIDKNENEFVCYVTKKSTSVVQVFSKTGETVSDHKHIIQFIKDFKTQCQS